METPEDDFVPYGPEWEKEMMKWNKPMLIDYIRKLLNDPLRSELIAALEELNNAWKISHDKYNDWLPTGELQKAFEDVTALISKHKAQ